MKRIAATLLPLTIATAMASTWGTGSFENSYATEWVSTVVRAHDTAPIYATLEEIRKEAIIAESSSCSAIAAAEVVAAMLGHPSPSLPPELAEWLKQQAQQRPTEAQLALARTVLLRVLDGKQSEIAAFWGNSDPYGWRTNVNGLLDRLAAKERGGTGAGLSNSALSPAHSRVTPPAEGTQAARRGARAGYRWR